MITRGSDLNLSSQNLGGVASSSNQISDISVGSGGVLGDSTKILPAQYKKI